MPVSVRVFCAHEKERKNYKNIPYSESESKWMLMTKWLRHYQLEKIMKYIECEQLW